MRNANVRGAGDSVSAAFAAAPVGIALRASRAYCLCLRAALAVRVSAGRL